MDCPKCGAYNPEDRTQCWKCDELLPVKKETRKRSDQTGKMGMWTWLILIILGAVWLLGMCNSPQQTQQPSSQAPAVVRLLL